MRATALISPSPCGRGLGGGGRGAGVAPSPKPALQQPHYNGIASSVSILSLSSTTIRSLNRNGVVEMSIRSR